MALGAKREDVLRLVIQTGLRLVLGGIVVGLLASLVLGRMMATQLTGVSTCDPATLAGTTILLVATAAAACWMPARRAARVEPVVALRYE
jgi:putative ABC transport system permease protein